MVTLSVVCVNWNSLNFLHDCLESLFRNTTELSFEVIVYDNGSLLDEVHGLEKEFPQVRVFRSSQNIGFVAANNRASDYATGEYLLFLNPDTKIVGNALSDMVNKLRSIRDAGIVGCKLLNADRSTQMSCIQRYPRIVNQVLDAEFLQRLWPTAPLWGLSPLLSKMSKPVNVEAVSGACLMIRRDLFEQAGRFSADNFMYAEDVDLCLNVRKLGRKSYYIPTSSVVHFGGGSSQRHPLSQWTAVMQRESIFRFCRKHRGHRYAILYRFSIGLAALVRLLVIACTCALTPTARSKRPARAYEKWRAVLRWSLGLENQTIKATRHS